MTLQNNHNNTEQFLMVPYRILSVNDVNGHKFNDGLKTLYCYLRGWGDNAFPSYHKIASVFGITERGAEERIKQLVRMGLIKKVNRVGTSNKYEVLDIPCDAPEPLCEDVEQDNTTIFPDAVNEPVAPAPSLEEIAKILAANVSKRKWGDGFINYAKGIAKKENITLPNDIEHYFERKYNKVYTDYFDTSLPF